jgi:hypothetical protein
MCRLIVGGPYEGKKSIGCGEFEVPTPAAKGTDIGKMLEAKGYKFDVIEK